MKHTYYTISDAARKMNVEAHVLRYWEEELALEIPRNELGHRCYRDKDIQIFQYIKKLKEEGFSLHEIREALPHAELESSIPDLQSKEEIDVPMRRTPKTLPQKTQVTPPPTTDKLGQFREIMGSIINQAIVSNNEQLATMICESTSERVMKEMNYLFRTLDEDEEVRIKQLEAAVLAAISTKREIAVSRAFAKGKKTLFGKKIK